MTPLDRSIATIRHIDELNHRSRWVNDLHPLAKLLCTVCFIAVTVSFDRYDVLGLAIMAVYPFVTFELADLSFVDALGRLRAVLPLLVLLGIFNPFLDRAPVVLAGITITAGVLSMVTLIGKGLLAVLASYLLIATTPIETICYALRLLHVPRLLVTELLLIYRYLTLLLQETSALTKAYALRAPRQNGIRFAAWGPLTGLLLLRSMDRATVVYHSMTLRGYRGDFAYLRQSVRWRVRDVLYGTVWCSVFLICRRVPVLLVIGGLLL